MLYPPFLFSAIWFLSLAALVLSGNTFYPIGPETLLVYLVGAICFSIGGLYGLCLIKKDINSFMLIEQQVARVHRILDIGLIVVIVGLPFYLMKIRQSVDLLDYYVLAKLHEANVEASASSGRSFIFLNNLVVMATFLALAMHYENDGTTGRRWRSIFSIIVAILYNIFTGSKGWVMILPTLAFISFIAKKKLQISTLGLVIGVSLVLFGGSLMMTNYVYGDVGDSLEISRILTKTIQNYWLGGLVAFNRIVEAPDSIAAVQTLGRVFLETSNALGASFEIPSIHADYTQIASSGDDTNTYTIYFSYYKDFGWFGIVVGMSALGMGLSLIYRYALRNYPIAVFVMGTAAVGIVLSFNAEHFILGINYYLKLMIFYYFVYYVSTRNYSWKS